MRNLPSNIEIGHGTTVEEAKKIIARATRTSDHNRVAIVDTTTKAIIKDRLSILAQQPGVKATGEIAVKDLGTPPHSPLIVSPNPAAPRN